ncbi:MAG: hypothetical protein JOY59_03405 [Candidatus Eremiobacteraeota bacterium]|nr:hypothetical protein [Candidatus Eremiobacteraeota bacterium]
MIVDLSDATTVDSTFMTELLWFLRRHGKIERSAIVAHSNVARSLAMGGLDRKVRIVADYQRALDVLSLEA